MPQSWNVSGDNWIHDAQRGTYLVETVDDNNSESSNSESSDDDSVTTLFESSLRGGIDLDDIMVRAAHAQ